VAHRCGDEGPGEIAGSDVALAGNPETASGRRGDVRFNPPEFDGIEQIVDDISVRERARRAFQLVSFVKRERNLDRPVAFVLDLLPAVAGNAREKLVVQGKASKAEREQCRVVAFDVGSQDAR